MDKGPLSRVTRQRWEDRGRRRRVSMRFTTWTLSPAISVNAFSFFLYRSIVLVDFVAFVLGGFNLFRCDGEFWLVAGFVRYFTGKTCFHWCEDVFAGPVLSKVFHWGIN